MRLYLQRSSPSGRQYQIREYGTKTGVLLLTELFNWSNPTRRRCVETDKERARPIPLCSIRHTRHDVVELRVASTTNQEAFVAPRIVAEDRRMGLLSISIG